MPASGQKPAVRGIHPGASPYAAPSAFCAADFPAPPLKPAPPPPRGPGGLGRSGVAGVEYRTLPADFARGPVKP